MFPKKSILLIKHIVTGSQNHKFLPRKNIIFKGGVPERKIRDNVVVRSFRTSTSKIAYSVKKVIRVLIIYFSLIIESLVCKLSKL